MPGPRHPSGSTTVHTTNILLDFRYEGTLLLIMYIVYVAIMYFNPRLRKYVEAKVSSRCQQHPRNTSPVSETETETETETSMDSERQPLLSEDSKLRSGRYGFQEPTWSQDSVSLWSGHKTPRMGRQYSPHDCVIVEQNEDEEEDSESKDKEMETESGHDVDSLPSSQETLVHTNSDNNEQNTLKGDASGHPAPHSQREVTFQEDNKAHKNAIGSREVTLRSFQAKHQPEMPIVPSCMKSSDKCPETKLLERQGHEPGVFSTSHVTPVANENVKSYGAVAPAEHQVAPPVAVLELSEQEEEPHHHGNFNGSQSSSSPEGQFSASCVESGVDPGFWSGGPSGVLTPGGLSLKFAQNCLKTA